MMKNYDESVEINHNSNWPYITDHPYLILITDDSGPGKTNVLMNLFLYVKDPFESKYQSLINRREKVEIKKLKNLEAFIEYSQAIDDVYENLEDYNLTK